MIFANLKIQDVIIHEVFVRDENRTLVPPRYGHQLINLNVKAADELRNRVVTAMGKASQSVEMEIQRHAPGSMMMLARDLLNADRPGFIGKSRTAADGLASAQLARHIPGGILVVFRGEVGHPAKRVVCLIKAEPQAGFSRIEGAGGLDLQFLEDLILTPHAKLYKIGVFAEIDRDAAAGANPVEGFKAFIYDVAMTITNRDAAAQYFYDGFLGCGFPQSSARLTKEFYDLTKEFIRKLEIPEEDKADLYGGLYTYLKVDQAQTVQVSAFAQSYLADAHMKDTYDAFMKSRQFPTNAVHKDLVEVAPHLKQRKIRFSSDIRLTAPADKFEELVTMEVIDAVSQGEGQKWTRITIRDRITSQE
jgi:hypothetical protein